MEPLQLAPRRKGIAALSLSENPNTRQTVYLRGSLRVISDVGSDDEEEEKKEEPCEDVTHITEETNCILKLLSENEGSAQLYLGNLRVWIVTECKEIQFLLIFVWSFHRICKLI